MTGDQADFNARLRAVLPPWFGAAGAPVPILDAALDGIAWALAQVYGLYAYLNLQTRLATATEGWLDLASNDFFGRLLPRLTNEADAKFSTRIRTEVLRDRNTRAAIDAAVSDLTGYHPRIFEAWRGPDCGGYGDVSLAYGRVGRYGSRDTPYEVMVIHPAPQGYGLPNRGGWGSGVGGYGSGNFSFCDDTLIVGSGPVINDILRSVELVRAAGVTAYVRFTDEAYSPALPTEATEVPQDDTAIDNLAFDFSNPDNAILLGV